MMRWLKTYAPYVAVTAAVMLPLLLPGYILTLDAVFTPEIRMPDTVASDYLWRVLLHVLNIVVPSQIIEKLIFVGILLGSGIGMHQLIVGLRQKGKELVWPWATYGAGIFYMVNPFTYARFMAGQYGVLLGYALLPFFVRFLLDFAAKPDRRSMLRVGLLALLISIVSVPTIGELAVVVLCVIALAIWRQRKNKAQLRQYATYGLAALGLFALLSSYWLLPAVLGKGMGESVAQFDASHSAAFATLGDTLLGKAMHVLRLQGFWAEGHDLFWLPQERLVGWGTVRLLVWALIIGGAVVFWRRNRGRAAAFLTMGGIALLLAIGVVPGLASLGYREPQKFAGLLALVFAVLLAYGAARLVARAEHRSATLAPLTKGGLVVLIFVFTPTMWWGFYNQLSPRHYPQDWVAMNERLKTEAGDSKVAFVPWHQYMSFGFSGRIIANPAEHFFDVRVLASNDPELGVIRPEAGEERTVIGALLRPGHQPADLAKQLAAHNIRYVLLAKELDYKKYGYLDTARDLTVVADTPTLRLYRNTAMQEGK